MRRRAACALALLSAAVLAGCLPRAPGGKAASPVSHVPMADPFVLKVGTRYYAFVSNYLGPTRNVPVMESTDPMHRWTELGDVLPDLGRWAEEGNTWAPGVLPRGDQFVLFYTARHAGNGKQCIGRAKSSGVAGLYVDARDEPLICQVSQGGSIDPAPFVAPNDVPYLVWKTEGVIGRAPTKFFSQQLTPSGAALVDGTRVKLLQTEQPWEGSVIENPAMKFARGSYWVFYSANIWSTANYATGVARCSGPSGPCGRVYSTPVLGNRGLAIGPGGPTFFRKPSGALMLAFSAWTYPNIGYESGGERRLHALRLTFRKNGLPKVG
jgi:beta-xylosidase